MTIPFTVIDKATRQIQFSGTSDHPKVWESDTMEVLEGVCYESNGWVDYNLDQQYVPEAPGTDFVWDWATKEWIAPSLDDVKEKKWKEIKAVRERKITGTFTHDSNVYDLNVVNLSGASIDARESIIAGEEWSQVWVLADNSMITLNAEQMIAVARAAKQAVSALWATSMYLRWVIESATTAEEVLAVTWP